MDVNQVYRARRILQSVCRTSRQVVWETWKRDIERTSYDEGFMICQVCGRAQHDTIAERATMGDNFGGSMAKREILAILDQLGKGDIFIDT